MNSVQMFRHVVLTHDRYKEKNILTINSEKSSRGFSEEHAMTPIFNFTCVMVTGEISYTEPAGNSLFFAVEICVDKYYCYFVNSFGFFHFFSFLSYWFITSAITRARSFEPIPE